jgi:putative nucleotidyltransferase with HDIG domain
MPRKEGPLGSEAVQEIKAKLSLINAIGAFVAFLLLGIIVGALYRPVREYFVFLPELSLYVIVLFAFVLLLAGSISSRVLSQRVVRTIRDYQDKLDTVLNVTREIREEIYGDILLGKIAEYSTTLTGSELCAVLLDEEGRLAFKALRGYDMSELSETSIPGETGIAGWVMEHGVPLFVDTKGAEAGFESSLSAVSDYQVKSVLCVPLITNKKCIGAIELVNKEDGTFTQRDVEIVSYLADQAAISIERAVFYEDHRNYEIHMTEMLVDLIDRVLPDSMVPEKQGHSRRVARYATMLAKSVGMPVEKQRRLYYAGLLHDIGFLKTVLSDSFSEDIMHKHSSEGYIMLNRISFYRDISQYVLHHHERFDGTGYPQGLAGADIPLESRILSVAELFEKAVSKSGAEETEGYGRACEVLKEQAGTALDPSLVELFVMEMENAAG